MRLERKVMSDDIDEMDIEDLRDSVRILRDLDDRNAVLVAKYKAKLDKHKWQPIETAPKDELIILTYDPDDHNYYVRRWSKKRDTWVDYPDEDVNYDYDEKENFKYWRPLLETRRA